MHGGPPRDVILLVRRRSLISSNCSFITTVVFFFFCRNPGKSAKQRATAVYQHREHCKSKWPGLHEQQWPAQHETSTGPLHYSVYCYLCLCGSVIYCTLNQCKCEPSSRRTEPKQKRKKLPRNSIRRRNGFAINPLLFVLHHN